MRRGARRSDDTAGLYPRLLGERWTELADPVRQAHSLRDGECARGWFSICRGSGLMARTVATVLKLPRTASGARAELRIAAEKGGERWQRRFDDMALTTRQCQVGDALLGERIGAFELRFELQPSTGGLVYRQVGAGIRLGCFYIPLSPRWAPMIAAQEMPADDGVRVEVSVTHSRAGLLLSYDGHIRVAELRG